MSIQLYNTLTNKKEPLETLEPGKVKMYVCGPTVYNKAHIGHAMSAMVFDIIRRYLEYRGYDVQFAMNFTDVDDKIIKRANEMGVDPFKLAEGYIDDFQQDMKDLNIKPATFNPRATQEIDEFFANTHLDRQQMELVYDYLISQKIQVEGYKKGESSSIAQPKKIESEEALESGMEEAEEYPHSMELYLNEIAQLSRLEAEEELQLFALAVLGDTDAKRRLVEVYLPMVCELAGDYDGTELPVEDLIQEGNIGLLMAVEALEERDSLAAYQVQLMNAVNQHMQDVLQEQKDLRELGDGIAKRVTHLSQAIHNLEEDLEHKVSVEELSAYLEMPVQEIRDILKMAGDELDVDGAEQG